MFRLDGKIAVVTGGGSGIGLATARRLAQAGSWVTVIDRDPAAAEAADIVDTTASHFETHQRVNAWGVINGMKAAREFMSRGGAIVNTSSMLGVIGTPGYASCSASKHAVIAATKIAALEFGSAGIRVNSVAPTTVDTPMLHSFAAGAQEAAAYTKASALGRIIEPEHVAALIHFLVTDDCPVISGQTIAIDAGITAGVSSSAWDAAAVS